MRSFQALMIVMISLVGSSLWAGNAYMDYWEHTEYPRQGCGSDMPYHLPDNAIATTNGFKFMASATTTESEAQIVTDTYGRSKVMSACKSKLIKKVRASSVCPTQYLNINEATYEEDSSYLGFATSCQAEIHCISSQSEQYGVQPASN